MQKMKNTLLTTVMAATFAAICFCMQTTEATAAWGDYDTTFGFLGSVIDPVANHFPKQVALQADGKILITGYRVVGGKERFFLRRYLSNGQLDTSFGNGGAAVSNAFIVMEADYCGLDILVQTNGKITVVGTGNDHPTVWRFSSSGNGDASLGNGGMKTLSAYNTPNNNMDSTAQDSAAIIGVRKTGETNLFLIRLGSNGNLDGTFGIGGEVETPFQGSLEHSIKVETSDGKITAGGVSPTFGFGVARWTANGSVDNTFTFANQYAEQTYPSAFTTVSDGRYVMPRTIDGQGALPAFAYLSILATDGLYQSTALIEYLPGSDGPPTPTCPQILSVQQNGRLVVKGLTKIYRYDPTLATKTSNSCPNYAALDSKTKAVLQTDDKMLAAGRYSGYIAMVRTLP